MQKNCNFQFSVKNSKFLSSHTRDTFCARMALLSRSKSHFHLRNEVSRILHFTASYASTSVIVPIEALVLSDKEKYSSWGRRKDFYWRARLSDSCRMAESGASKELDLESKMFICE